MAKLPVFPFVVLAAGALLLGGKRRKTGGAGLPAVRLADGLRGSVAYWPPDPPAHVSATGDYCQPAEGQFGAIDSEGQCKVFFDYVQHMPMLREVIAEVWNDMGPDDICSLPRSVILYQGTPKEEWVLQPEIAAVAKEALLRMYPVLESGHLPPIPYPEQYDPDAQLSPYWIHVVWKFAVYAVSSELCGFEPIT